MTAANDVPAPRRAIVLGGASAIGRFLLPMLVPAGIDAVALTRDPARTGTPWRRWSDGRLDTALAAGERFDVALHLAPLTILPALVPDLARHGVRRLIAFGTTSRYYKTASGDAHERAFIRGFVDAEADVAAACEAHGIAWTLFRPTLVYGGGTDANVALVARVVGKLGFFPLVAGGRGLRQPVHAADLAQACLQALDRPATHGRAYDLSGGSTLTYRAMVEAICVAMNRAPRTIDVPLPLFRLAIRVARLLPAFRKISPEAAMRQGMDLCFDHTGATRDFGYAPRAFTLDATALPR